ncbi:MAG: HRDC domain-containing protein, partial [Rhodomicrobium sp.]
KRKSRLMWCSPTKTLLDMVHLKPQTRDQMTMVHGVGAAKLEQYGETFLTAIREHMANPVREAADGTAQ